MLEEFPSGDIADAVIVFSRDDGLDGADLAAIEEVRTTINSERREGRRRDRPADPLRGQGRDADRAASDVPDEADELLIDAVDDIRADSTTCPRASQAKVTGAAGFSADAIDVFEQINGTLLLATAGLVLILLIVIYRSPIFWFIPLLRGAARRGHRARRRLRARRGRA